MLKNTIQFNLIQFCPDFTPLCWNKVRWHHYRCPNLEENRNLRCMWIFILKLPRIQDLVFLSQIHQSANVGHKVISWLILRWIHTKSQGVLFWDRISELTSVQKLYSDQSGHGGVDLHHSICKKYHNFKKGTII